MEPPFFGRGGEVVAVIFQFQKSYEVNYGTIRKSDGGFLYRLSIVTVALSSGQSKEERGGTASPTYYF